MAIVRLIGLLHHDVNQDAITVIPLSIYSTVETGMYLIAACIPTYRPLYNYAKQKLTFTLGRYRVPEDDEELQQIRNPSSSATKT